MADDLLNMKIDIDSRDFFEAEKASKKFQRSLLMIEEAFRDGRMHAGRYNSEIMKQTKELAKLGGGYKKAQADVHAYMKTLRNATDDQIKFASGMAKSGKGMRNFELLAQQAGYQVGDFAVQVQSGTNIAVAFGQQMSQLLGFLGPYGALAGAGVAIATGIIAPFIKAKDEVNNLQEEIESLETAISEMAGAGASIEGGITQKLINAQIELLALVALTKSEGFKMAMGMLAGQDAGQASVATGMVEEELATREQLVSTLERERNQAAILVTQRRVMAALVGDQVQEAENVANANRVNSGIYEDHIASSKWLEGSDERRAKLAASRWAEWQRRQKQLKKAQDDETAAQNKINKLFEQNLANLEQQTLQANAKINNYDDELGLLKAQQQIRRDNLLEAAANNDLSYEQRRELSGQLSVLEDQEQQLLRLKQEEEGRLNRQRQLNDLMKVNYKAIDDESRLMEMSLTPSKQSGPKKEKEKRAPKDVIGDMLKETRHQQKLLQLTEDQRRGEEILFQLRSQGVNLTDERVSALLAETEAVYRATQAEERRKEKIDMFSGHIENAFMAMVQGSQSVESAFKSLMRNIILDIYQQMVAKQAASFILGMFGFAKGGVFNNGQVTPFASGGVVNRPTLFPMANGMGLMGEAGPEAIMPLKRGSDGKLGVSAEAGATIVQNINVSTGVQQTVRTEIKSLLPQIADAAKGAVVDAKRRGGSYGRVFN